MRIMVVEDDDLLGRAISRMLRGEDVIVERDPQQALERLTSGDWFDFVLLDLHLPGMDGETLAIAARAVLGADTPTLVLMSGCDVTGSAAVDDVLLKPFPIALLRAATAKVEKRKLARAAATTQRMPCGRQLACACR